MRHAERMPDMAIAYKRSARHWVEGLPWQSPQLPIPDRLSLVGVNFGHVYCP